MQYDSRRQRAANGVSRPDYQGGVVRMTDDHNAAALAQSFGRAKSRDNDCTAKKAHIQFSHVHSSLIELTVIDVRRGAMHALQLGAHE